MTEMTLEDFKRGMEVLEERAKADQEAMGSPYLTLSATVYGRRGRLFYRTGTLHEEAAERLLRERMTEPEEVSGLERVRAIIQSALVVTFVAHRMFDEPDAVRVLLRGEVDGQPAMMFVCVIKSLRLLEIDLGRQPYVIEAFDLQVAPTRRLYLSGVELAMRLWFERVFPSMALPEIVVEPHGGSIERLKGQGRDYWKDVDVDAYIREERASWDRDEEDKPTKTD